MALYEYKCIKCGHIDVEDWPMGTAPDHKLHGHGKGKNFHFVRMDRVYSFNTTNMPTQAGRKM